MRFQRSRLSRIGMIGAVLATAALPGCIVVSSRDSDYERIEEKKADAQYMAARAELERINLERHKIGLAPIEAPSRPADVDECAPSPDPK